MILLQGQMPVNRYEEEQIALPPVSPPSMFVDTIKLPVQTRFNLLCGATIECSAQATSELYGKKIFYLLFNFQIAFKFFTDFFA
jgi:hypothetical protein